MKYSGVCRKPLRDQIPGMVHFKEMKMRTDLNRAIPGVTDFNFGFRLTGIKFNRGIRK